jgi:hypothetical protein
MIDEVSHSYIITGKINPPTPYKAPVSRYGHDDVKVFEE